MTHNLRITILLLIAFLLHVVPMESQSRWEQVRTETSTGSDIACNDAGICVAGFMIGLGGDTYILRSTDEGASWEEVYRDTRTYAPTHVPLRIGTAEFAGTTTVIFSMDSGYVLRSTDAGETWSRREVDTGRVGFAGNISMYDSLHGLCVIRASFQETWYARDRLFITRDGGYTWLESPTPPRVPGRTDSNAINDVVCIGPDRFLVLYSLSPLGDSTMTTMVSNDAGHSWAESRTATPREFGVGKPQVHFFNENAGILTGIASSIGDSGIVMRTTDAGSTWNTVFLGFMSSDNSQSVFGGMWDSDFRSLDTGIAGLYYGFASTVDGGRTWTIDSADGSPWDVQAVSYADERTAVGLTRYPVIYRGTTGSSSVVDGAALRSDSSDLSILAQRNSWVEVKVPCADDAISVSIVDMRGSTVIRTDQISASQGSVSIQVPRQPGLYFVRTGGCGIRGVHRLMVID